MGKFEDREINLSIHLSLSLSLFSIFYFHAFSLRRYGASVSLTGSIDRSIEKLIRCHASV